MKIRKKTEKQRKPEKQKKHILVYVFFVCCFFWPPANDLPSSYAVVSRGAVSRQCLGVSLYLCGASPT